MDDRRHHLKAKVLLEFTAALRSFLVKQIKVSPTKNRSEKDTWKLKEPEDDDEVHGNATIYLKNMKALSEKACFKELHELPISDLDVILTCRREYL